MLEGNGLKVYCFSDEAVDSRYQNDVIYKLFMGIFCFLC